MVTMKVQKKGKFLCEMIKKDEDTFVIIGKRIKPQESAQEIIDNVQ